MQRNKAEFILWLAAVIAVRTVSIAAAQQPTKIPRIGVVSASAVNAADRVEAFRRGLRDLGYTEGRNIVIEYRYTEGKLDRYRAVVAELVRLKVDVIVSGGATATRAAKEATATIPVVMMQDPDPVGNGFGQPGASRRKHYRTIVAYRGLIGKKAGNIERDIAQTVTRDRFSIFNECGERTTVAGNRACRTSAETQAAPT
jgi:hypothetical protein